MLSKNRNLTWTERWTSVSYIHGTTECCTVTLLARILLFLQRPKGIGLLSVRYSSVALAKSVTVCVISRINTDPLILAVHSDLN
jgi:hypothetical protein